MIARCVRATVVCGSVRRRHPQVCHAVAAEAGESEWPELLPHVAASLQQAAAAPATVTVLYFLLEKLVE